MKLVTDYINIATVFFLFLSIGCSNIFSGVGTNYHSPPKDIDTFIEDGTQITFIAGGFKDLEKHISPVYLEYRPCHQPQFETIAGVVKSGSHDRVTYLAYLPQRLSENTCIEYRFMFVFDGATNYTQLYRVLSGGGT